MIFSRDLKFYWKRFYINIFKGLFYFDRSRSFSLGQHIVILTDFQCHLGFDV